jgi:predicted nucleic acid-binding protein
VTIASVSEQFVVDSSGWLEYLTEDSKAAAFGLYLEGEAEVLVPSIVIFEVYKHLAKQRGKALAERFVSQTLQRKVISLDETIVLAAANLSLDHRLTMRDAIVYATARVCQAKLVTGDLHFRGLPGVIIP